LESRLNQWGFESPNQLCHAVVAGQFPKQRDEQVERLLDRIRDKGIKALDRIRDKLKEDGSRN